MPPGAAAGDLYPSVPQQPGTSIRLAGRDAKLLIAGYDMGVATAAVLDVGADDARAHRRPRRRAALRAPGRGRRDRAALRAPPKVSVLAGSVQSTWDADRHDLRLNYVHDGLARVLIEPAGGTPLELLLATDATAAKFWRQDTGAGPVLVRGPELVRTASVAGGALALTGDTATSTPLEVLAPPAVRRSRGTAASSPPPAAPATGRSPARSPGRRR